jgi:hypothetical protein
VPFDYVLRVAGYSAVYVLGVLGVGTFFLAGRELAS